MIEASDICILRDLAKRVAEIAALPVMAERREQWYRHNALEPGPPMMLVFPEGAWQELLPDSALRCAGEEARRMEWQLRSRIYYHEHFADDTVIERRWVVHKAIRNTGWGLEARRIPSPTARGSWHFDPVIHTAADLEKLRFPEVEHDEQATRRRLEQALELFDGILDVRLVGVAHVSFHLMAIYTGLRGLEEVMLDMVDNPSMLHDAMRFLEEGHRRLIAQYERMNLLSLNNDETYHSSGGVGYTRSLPQADFDGVHVRPCDMWASAEAQEMAQVSPEMHEEFILQYERRLLAPFGLNGYGCCEDLTRKLDAVLTIPRIRRISIAPSADVEACAEKLGNGAILSWKPQPAHLAGDFDAQFIRGYIARAVRASRRHGCVMEMILKDTHTCANRPERFDMWTRIAREVIDSEA